MFDAKHSTVEVITDLGDVAVLGNDCVQVSADVAVGESGHSKCKRSLLKTLSIG